MDRAGLSRAKCPAGILAKIILCHKNKTFILQNRHKKIFAALDSPALPMLFLLTP